MPTGYTYAIGEDISFEDFVLKCGMAFGACIHQRDSNDEFPRLDDGKFRGSTDGGYHVTAYNEAREQLAKLNAMGNAERIEFGQKAQEEEIATYQKLLNEKVVLKAKYEAMLARVYAWTPPTPDHNNLKQFMIDQITDSIKHDCDVAYYIDELAKAGQKKPYQFYEAAIKSAEWNIEYHSKQKETGRKIDENSNRWILSLYESLGVDYKSKWPD